MNIHVAAVPKRLRITESMICDFLIDPVLGVKIIFGVELDAFQRARLRTYWWVPEVMDSSGFSSAKTITFFLFCNLRAVLIPNQVIGAFYLSFEAGKQIFWPYYRSSIVSSPIFKAQLGGLDEQGEEVKGTQKNPSCWVARFRNGNEIRMPAPDWMKDAKSQAGLRFNVAGIDEWTKVEATGTTGIDSQFLGRITAPSFNQHHPLWTNHTIFLATAEHRAHPGWRRYQAFKRRVDRGDPTCSILNFSYKDYSNRLAHTGKTFKEEYRMDGKIKSMREQLTPDHVLREMFGVWSDSTRGWYSQEVVANAIARGAKAGVEVLNVKDGAPAYYHFMGIDPAPALGERSDDGVIVAARACVKPQIAMVQALKGETPFSEEPSDWNFEFIFGYRCRKHSVRQWSGRIHDVNDRFAPEMICMDYNGGGAHIGLELRSAKQLINDADVQRVPIASPEEALPDARYVLCMFKRGDPCIEAKWPHLAGDDLLNDAMHVAFQSALEHSVLLPVPWDERSSADRERLTASWPAQQVWSARILSEGATQLASIVVAMNEDGTWQTTKRGARIFSSTGKKDIAYAMIYTYVGFLCWLKRVAWLGGVGGGGSDKPESW
ncbi:MAG: hypothetical protein IT581_06430 [Verrucomicrobiales bacterium]|nr:hypothetical protein [Verrucomicrobiales bacterium]